MPTIRCGVCNGALRHLFAFEFGCVATRDTSHDKNTALTAHLYAPPRLLCCMAVQQKPEGQEFSCFLWYLVDTGDYVVWQYAGPFQALGIAEQYAVATEGTSPVV
uniref:Uncharacterized protein n=1 Tax=Eutreptiella gymnastica TaxID=73025 RepID=A0A7S4D308_9EUGL